MPRAGQVTSIKGRGSFWGLNSRGGPQGQLLPKGQIQGPRGTQRGPSSGCMSTADAESGDAVRTGLPQAPRELETVAFKGVVSRPLREGGLREEERSSGGPGARQRELPTPVPGPQIRSKASLSWALESGPTTSTHPQGFVSALSPSKNQTVYVLNLLTGEQGLPGPTAPGTGSSNRTESRLCLPA